MILRRFMKHVKEQNWFAVGLDVIVVIVGIFLGLQVQEWNEQRVERADEAEYLVRLHEDFSQSISSNENAIQVAYNQWEDGKRIFDILSNCQLDVKDRDMFARGLYGTGKFLPIVLNRTTIDELNSTGKFRTIQNSELRNFISEHVYDIDMVNHLFTMMNDSIVPHLTAIEKNFSYNMSELDPHKKTRDVTWNSLLIDFDKVCKNDQFKNAITHVNLYINDLFIFAQPILDKQRQILAMIDAEIKKKR